MHDATRAVGSNMFQELDLSLTSQDPLSTAFENVVPECRGAICVHT